jgi:hypothetical protein
MIKKTNMSKTKKYWNVRIYFQFTFNILLHVQMLWNIFFHKAFNVKEGLNFFKSHNS